MKFEQWLKKNKGRTYMEILNEIVDIEDKEYFCEWAKTQRLEEYYGDDWAMLAISDLNDRLSKLEKKKDKK